VETTIWSRLLSRNHAPQSRDENRVNKTLIEFAQKHEVKLIASNNTYYLNKEDANAHDILLCVKDGEKQATPIGRGRGYRYGLPNQDITTNQMRR
jgi:DNA polymerase-3 subunit alpha